MLLVTSNSPHIDWESNSQTAGALRLPSLPRAEWAYNKQLVGSLTVKAAGGSQSALIDVLENSLAKSLPHGVTGLVLSKALECRSRSGQLTLNDVVAIDTLVRAQNHAWSENAVADSHKCHKPPRCQNYLPHPLKQFLLLSAQTWSGLLLSGRPSKS